mmetsp:Transcript_16701/g.54372  ORF Transcript_16701/g.54372 Transcript_16701/m.54372 type:complete len:537 (+) Transcript_16701:110-1720(+)
MCLDPSPSFALQRRMRKHPTTSWKDFDVMRCVSLETVSVGLIVGRVAAASMEAKAALVSLAAAAALVESQSRERGLTAGATCVPSALAAVYGAVHGGTRRNAAWRAFAASATAAATGLGSSFFSSSSRSGAVVGFATWLALTKEDPFFFEEKRSLLLRGALAVGTQVTASRLARCATGRSPRRAGEALGVASILAVLADATFFLPSPLSDAPAVGVVWIGLLAVVATVFLASARSGHSGGGGGDNNKREEGRLFLFLATLGCGLVGWVACRLVVGVDPFAWLLRDLLGRRRKRVLAAWFASLAAGLPLVLLARPAVGRVAARKLFHVLAVCLFAPVALEDPTLLQVAYGVALGLLVWLEAARNVAGKTSLVRRTLTDFYAPFLDDHEKEGVALAHIYLLFGCAAPHWLASLLANFQKDGWTDGGGLLKNNPPQVRVLRLAGVAVLGLGDASAAVVGQAIGTRHWPRSRRTLEGSLAFFLAVALPPGLCAPSGTYWASLAASAGLLACFEATTSQNDNLFLPLFAFALAASAGRSSS